MNQIEKYLASAKVELDGNGFSRICVWSKGNNDTNCIEVRKYQTILDEAKNETKIQEYLGNHPSLVPSCALLHPLVVAVSQAPAWFDGHGALFTGGNK